MNASGGGRGSVVGEGVRLSFVIGWLSLFVFSFVGEFWIKKDYTNFSEGDRSFVLWIFLAIILSSFALFLHIPLPPPPPPPPRYLFPMLMPRNEASLNTLFLQKDCYKNNFLSECGDLGLFLQFKFSQSN